ncbi:gliding motility-associated C-terminal domain-containing protein [Flavobacterium sp. ZT3R18]|uniref:T9SS type B sorting domain-containing protein n=1 Tax=Flavobacterium sp. ZT3R18 TaxID=2594429 RepID=UPI00163D73B1|nr:gliding motility-associated C-terminal domain-containing protein [Flavobacterium sp. ZT3R18]
MSSKTTFVFSLDTFLNFLMLLVLPSTLFLFAQGTITPQKLPFSQICAGAAHPSKPGEIFNEFQAQFTISGFASDVTFVVELSDPSGSFITPTPTTTLAPLAGTPPDTATDKTLTFSVPMNLVGSNTYQLRVKPSVGTPSSSFNINIPGSVKTLSAYYKAYNDPFFINDKNNIISYCNGGSVTLTIYNPTPSIPTSSPANYPQLKYNWYKDDALIPGQSGSSLVVSMNGVYYAELNYGPCSDVNYSSQRVTVSGTSGTVATITSSSGNPFCSSLGNTTLTASAGNVYIWKKNNAVIVGATDQTYQTNLPGVYTCEVDFGGCKSTGSIDLKVFEISSNISGVDKDKVNKIPQGQTVSVATTTTAVSPSYQWFLNGTTIPGETKSSLDVTAEGKYKVIIAQTSGCQISNEFLFEISYQTNFNVPQIANIVTPNNDGANDTWIIPDDYIDGKAKVMILSSLGEIVFETDNYDNYGTDDCVDKVHCSNWPNTNTPEFNNYNPVYYYIITPTGQSAKKGSITLVK